MPPKTKAEVGRMVASAAMKKYKNYSAIQLGKELNRLMALEKKQTTPANKIRIRVVKKLASKVSDKEISATEARQSLRKKVPEKKKVSKADFEKARKDLKDKKVSKPAPKKKTKKDTRKPPPKLKGLDWKLTEEKVNDKANYWSWKAKGADSIENVGETTTYDYDFDSLATDKNYFEPEETRKGMVFDDEGNEYPIAEFRRKYNALQRKLSKK